MRSHAADRRPHTGARVDCYVEEISNGNTDLVQHWLGAAGGGIPPGVPNRSVYGFRPMSANEFANHLAAGAALADAERARRGLNLPAPAGGVAAAAVPAAAPALLQVLTSFGSWPNMLKGVKLANEWCHLLGIQLMAIGA